MEKIRAWVGYSDYTKTHYYKDFEIIDKLPEIETTKKYNDEVTKIERIDLDCEQPNQDVYDYEYYKITRIDYEQFNDDYNDGQLEDSNYYTSYNYVCIKKKYEEEGEEE